MSVGVGIEQVTNHALILSAIFRGLGLKELDTLFAQGDGYLNAFFPEHKFVWGR